MRVFTPLLIALVAIAGSIVLTGCPQDPAYTGTYRDDTRLVFTQGDRIVNQTLPIPLISAEDGQADNHVLVKPLKALQTDANGNITRYEKEAIAVVLQNLLDDGEMAHLSDAFVQLDSVYGGNLEGERDIRYFGDSPSHLDNSGGNGAGPDGSPEIRNLEFGADILGILGVGTFGALLLNLIANGSYHDTTVFIDGPNWCGYPTHPAHLAHYGYYCRPWWGHKDNGDGKNGYTQPGLPFDQEQLGGGIQLTSNINLVKISYGYRLANGSAVRKTVFILIDNDADGIPNSEDPAPNNPNIPGEDPEGEGEPEGEDPEGEGEVDCGDCYGGTRSAEVTFYSIDSALPGYPNGRHELFFDSLNESLCNQFIDWPGGEPTKLHVIAFYPNDTTLSIESRPWRRQTNGQRIPEGVNLEPLYRDRGVDEISIAIAIEHPLCDNPDQNAYGGWYYLNTGRNPGLFEGDLSGEVPVLRGLYQYPVPQPCVPATITAQPVGGTITEGSSLTLSVTASGTGPLSYQWLRNGAAISGATSATLVANQAGSYSVRVTNECNTSGSVSTVTTVTVNPVATAPTITGQPTSATREVGASVTFTVTATGTAPLSYQWQKNGQPISGATNASYTIPMVTLGDASNYRVVVTNPAGTATSNVATLTVTEAIEESKIIIDLDLNASGQLTFAARLSNGRYPTNGFIGIANEAAITSIGLELYYLQGGAPWFERQLLPFTGWPTSGTISQFNASQRRILRFEAAANNPVAFSGNTGDTTKIEVRFRGTLVQRVENSEGQPAFQIDLAPYL